MDNLRGAALMVMAMFGFAIEDMLIKFMAGALPVGQILAMLGVGGALVFGTIVRFQGQRLAEPAMLAPPILIRAAGEIFGTVCFVTAIVVTPLSSASAILQATPLVVTLGAALFLSEPVGWRRWSAIFVGFFGVLLIVRPGMEGFSPLSLFAVGGVLGLAIRDIATRKASVQVTTMQLSYLGFLAVIPAGVFLMIFSGTPPVALSPRIALIFAATISIGVFAYYAIVAAMRVGEVSFVTPFRYTRMIFALIIGITVFSESPDMPTLIGAAIIVASGIYTVFRERKNRAPSAASLSKPGVPR
ncbi:EamA family transporter [Sulfitobacter sp. SK012]|uniref:DMT family transporter n=1 Tax=Sulfitobacter sp. SK012 TaxID=1389005 RepID=UPI000E0C29B6|nr:DMT family transporter [Sulfitobacter sp. SK012]AXI46228.1 EamA family transporter [Sulfitobacter sp. SK012]